MKTKYPSLILFILRVGIGWHFLYEGVFKLAGPDWSARAYLASSYGFMSGFYHWIAQNDTVMSFVDFLNVWGLVLIGAGLIVGVLTRVASMAGIVLLMLYYFAYPPFGNSIYGSPEGHYWIINRNLIESIALLVVFLLPAADYSLMNLLKKRKSPKVEKPDESELKPEYANRRREILKGLLTLPFLGGVAVAASVRENGYNPDASTGATMALQKFDLKDLKGTLPKGKIGNLEVSRIIMGCNLIAGYAHARDLLYANNLFRHYNTEKKIMETFSLAEQAGINTTNLVVSSAPFFNRYCDITGSKMQTVYQIHVKKDDPDPLHEAKLARDYGATFLYLQGESCDSLVRDERFDLIQKFLDEVRAMGMSAGLGSHSIGGPVITRGKGIKPDFYFKTMHHDNYWSAHPRENRVEFSVSKVRSKDHNQWHDNIFDLFPEKTVEFFNNVDVPLVGFKVLAAGAIKPEDGFRYAFGNGADFLCVGMFDFQIVQDVNIAIDVLTSDLKRTRPWYS
jgi:uncharacterized membrane protein YphA (DoxX/SURF4 family)